MNESTPLMIQKSKEHLKDSFIQMTDATVLMECQGTSENNMNNNNNKSTNRQTYLNIMKLCIGSGTLAMPYAAKQGGFLFHMIGLMFITKWNLYSVERMLSSQQLLLLHDITTLNSLDQKDHAITTTKHPTITTTTRATIFEKERKSTFSYIAYQTFGTIGVHMVDFVMIILMVGIILAYEDAILGFIKHTPLTTGSDRWDALFMLVFIIPVLMLPTYDSIAQVSALGTGIVCAVFVIIAIMGMNKDMDMHMDREIDVFSSRHLSDASLTSSSSSRRSSSSSSSSSSNANYIHPWPQSVSSLSHWFGIAVFGYGLVPFAFSIQESMAKPKDFPKTCSLSLWTVFGIYCLMGNLISIIYRQEDLEADVLSLLPNHGIIPTILRLLMTVVILTTLPLIIIPAGSLVYDKIIHLKLPVVSRLCSSFSNEDHTTQSTNAGIYVIRFILAITCAIISIELPSFVYVISFIGCLCVSFIGFVYPPLVHFICMFRKIQLQRSERYHHKHNHPMTPEDILKERKERIQTMTIDMIMLIWGILVTVYTSFETYKSIITQQH